MNWARLAFLGVKQPVLLGVFVNVDCTVNYIEKCGLSGLKQGFTNKSPNHVPLMDVNGAKRGKGKSLRHAISTKMREIYVPRAELRCAACAKWPKI